MSPGPQIVINPPALVPSRVSLLSSSDVITGDPSRWENGYAYSPEGCGEAGLGLLCPSPGFVKEASLNPTIVDFQPFFIYASDKCSTWSIRERDFYGRAERKLNAAESWWLENEFMLDTLGLGNHPVIDPSDTVVAGPLDPLDALAEIENAFSDCSHGGRFMIHVRPGILVQLVASHALRREGNVWLTPTDNIVVPGAGYPGTGPNGEPVGATEWIYATSMVQIRRGNLFWTPPQEEKTESNPQGIPVSAIDRRNNDVFVLAERVVSVAHDPSCCVLAAEVNRVLPPEPEPEPEEG